MDRYYYGVLMMLEWGFCKSFCLRFLWLVLSMGGGKMVGGEKGFFVCFLFGLVLF